LVIKIVRMDFSALIQLYLMDIFRQGSVNIMMLAGILAVHLLFNNHGPIFDILKQFYKQPSKNKLTIEASYMTSVFNGCKTVGISEAYRALNWKLTEHPSFSKNLSSISRADDFIHLPNKLVPLRIAPTNGPRHFQDDIWIELSETIDRPADKTVFTSMLITFLFTLRSSKTDLGKFIDDVVREYRTAKSNENHGHLYHFIHKTESKYSFKFSAY
jgi:hypothetical protein